MKTTYINIFLLALGLSSFYHGVVLLMGPLPMANNENKSMVEWQKEMERSFIQIIPK